MSQHIYMIKQTAARKFLRLFTIIGIGLFTLIIPNDLSASHLVGGDITYECLGNNMYKVTLVVRRDCNLANPDALFDDPASIGIFDLVTNQRLIELGVNGQILIPLNNDDTLNQFLISRCTVTTGDICVHQTTYEMTVELPFNPNGYLLSYERCCRNRSVLNVSDPLNTGMTVYTKITAVSQTLCNSSPSFKQWAPIYICTGDDVTFDHGATDVNGDSIVYSLCTPLRGATREIPRPQPPFGPPYEEITWNGPLYGIDNMLGSDVPLKIDAETGLLSGGPDIIGQFIVGVCMEEYRDGELLSMVRRDFQYNVRDCIDDIIAKIDVPNEFCGTNTGTFINESQNVDSVVWYPDLINDPLLKVSTYDLVHTYPGPGTYTVRLIAGVSSGACFDTIDSEVTFYLEDVNPIVLANIPDEVKGCFGEQVSLNPDGNPDFEYEWSPAEFFGDPTSFNPTITIDSPIVVKVKVRDPRSNCRDEKEIAVRIPILETLNMIPDSAIGCLGQTIELNPNGIEEGFVYEWSPADKVSDPNAINPTIVIEPGLEITINITDPNVEGCTLEKTIVAFDIIDLALDAIDDINEGCPGETIFLNPNANPELEYEWSPADLFEDPNSRNPSLVLDEEVEVTVKISKPDIEGCEGEKTILARIGVKAAIDAIPDTLETCINTPVELNPNGNPEYLWTWSPAELFDNPNAVNPILTLSDHVMISVLVEDTSADCSAEKEFLVFIPVLDAANQIPDTIIACFAGQVELNPNGSDRFTFEWQPADLLDDPNAINPSVQVNESTTFVVTITDTQIDDCSLVDTVLVFVPPLFSLTPSLPMDTTLCQGDSMVLSVTLTGEQVPIIWTDQNGIEIGMGSEIPVNPSALTIYTATAEDAYGCSMSESISINPGSIELEINYTLPDIVCSGDEIEVVTTNLKPQQELTYMWSPADQISGPTDGPNAILNPTADTDYILMTMNQSGCSRKDTIRIDIKELGPFDATADPSNIILGQMSQLETVNDPTYIYMWEPAGTLDNPTIFNPIATPTETTTYSVKITDSDGCMTTAEVTVTVEIPACEEPFIFIPNAFTPNNDGNNDILFVRGNTIDEIEFMIYNRWGEQVFRTTTPSTGWDGRHDGKEVAADVFGYYVWIRCTDGDIFTKKGNVTVLR